MMNKSKIEWCDFTWNPVTGCRHGCAYCYAAKQAHRFCGNVKINKGSDQLVEDPMSGNWYLKEPFRNDLGKVVPFPVGFEPCFREYTLPMLAQKKKPANIFVCSMADLFGEWVPDAWIQKVFEACETAPWHRYIFLTKNPGRYNDLYEKDMMPKGTKSWNKWYGCTITRETDEFFWIDQDAYGIDHYGFLSIEPIMSDFPVSAYMKEYGVRWIILGAETGNRKDKVKPEKEWIQHIIDSCRESGIKLFMKNNLRPYWDGELIQEFPWRPLGQN